MKMGLILSNACLEAFTAGTILGVSVTYFITRYKYPPKEVWKQGTEERYEFEDPDDEYRLILAVRNDLKMQKGKVAAQCGHAAVAAYAKAQKRPKLLKNWYKNGGTKIAVRLDSEEDLFGLAKKSKEMNVLYSIIQDAGHTQVAPGSRTVIAIGPAPKSGTKIAVRIDSEEELFTLEKKANELNVLASIVRDAGQTQVAPGTRTVIAIGPAPKSQLDKITGHLKLY